MYRFEELGQHCLECGDPLVYGRANRKFCSEACKNRYHNRRKSISWERYKQKVIRTLERNHGILSALMAAGLKSVDVIDLAQMGFNFNYITSYRRNGRRHRFCCFDIRYDIYGDRVVDIEDTGAVPKSNEADPKESPSESVR